ncbi:hypothetical protein AMTRI_Chr06g193980 [Amborella trichopoda]|uniref:histidine kinase 3 n=1 Tax=Amborella trichopoda TaxID=13333 RepID=UPI0005D3A867|nr:histidine kinase 3 [Amborella trichopoda]|eukprot:XP_020525565.1 histidine kinase 3 [Amborella trichopoda]
MSYLGLLDLDLKLPSWYSRTWRWVLLDFTMNFLIEAEIVEPKAGYLGGSVNSGLKWWGKFTGGCLKSYSHQKTSSSSSSKVGGTWRNKLLILWLIGGLLGSICVFWYLHGQSVGRRREMLASMCDERARMLQDQFNVSLNHVRALAILVSTFHHEKNPSAIDQRTFAEYTERTAFERPLTSGVAYAVKVLHSDRERFERQQGWVIKRMDAQDQAPVPDDEYFTEKQQPSPVQDEYAPVIFAQNTVSHIVSLDMMSGKEDRENVLRARASGKGVLTSPFRLLKSMRLGVVLTFAVYKKHLPSDATPMERIHATEGYLGGAFDVGSLVEKLLQQLSSKQTIIVNVYDTTNASAPISMYGSENPDMVDDSMHHVSNLNFGDPIRNHEMHCRFKHKAPFPYLAITTSVGVLVIAFLVGHIFQAAVNRIAEVEHDYQEMMELKMRAEAADVAKSQFLATVSHEIRTPMNGVLGMLQMLLDTELDVTQQDYAKTAQGSGKALINLINEVLDQAKIESGKLELEAVQFDVRAVLDDILSLFAGKSQDKGIELAVYVSDQVPDILIGDPGRFRQIITNLVGNSVKFTAKGHIFVSLHLVEEVESLMEISTEAAPNILSGPIKNGLINLYNTLSGYPIADKRRSWENFKAFNREGCLSPKTCSQSSFDSINLLITVEDTGVGIPKEAQARVFTPFMQADSSTSRTYGGTGIGLSISKCLVELMNGEIGFVSEPNIGSCFSFTAVFTRGKSASNGFKGYKPNQSDLGIFELKGMRALVVDPRPVRAKVTKYHLERLGLQVEIATDFGQALFTLTNGSRPFEMVLVDKEAWLHGSNVSRLLPRKNGSPHVPKLFLLATSMSPTEISSAKSAGCAETVIVKPLRASMLVASLQRGMGYGSKRNNLSQGLAISSLKSLLQGKKILVVDDNLVNLRVAAGALKKYGASVACASSGKAALLMLKPPHDFNACFMDVQMPEMDGFEATRRIRDMEHELNDKIEHGEALPDANGNVRRWHIPILAMTADVIQATQEACSRCGMDGYVSKPFEEDKLYREVARFF